MTSLRRRSLADRLTDASAGCADLDMLAERVFGAVAAEVPFAFGCLAVLDPANGMASRAFKSHPLPMNDEGFAAAEYGAPDVNQLAEIGRRRVPVGVLSVDTGGEPQTCRRMREYMTPRFGFTDELRVVCRVRSTAWAALGLYRTAGEPDFTPREGAVLADVHELIADGARQTLFAEQARDGRTAEDSPAVLIVDANDRVTDTTPSARQLLAELGPWHDDALPTSVESVVVLARGGQQGASTRALSRSGRWLTLRAMALEATAGGRSVVVTIDRASSATVGKLTLASRGLTARESEVTQLVLQGASTRAIAGTLHLSEHTVQDHLKAIFRKLEVTSRREMIALLILD